jgi:membrane protein DedA with SNARE-associated domain
MPFEFWIDRYGYAAVLIAGLFEGETILLLGGLAAHRGLLDLRAVIGWYVAGALCSNQLLFQLGRTRGPALLARWPVLQPRAARVLEFAHRHQRTVLLLYRFAVGARAMTPFVLGMSGVRRLRFTGLDSLILLSWATAVGCVGFWLGDSLEHWLPEIERSEHIVFASLAALGALAWLTRRAWARAR